MEKKAIVVDVRQELIGVDFLRFFCATGVLFTHYYHFFHNAVVETGSNFAIPAYTILWPLYDFGGFGVNVFWTISGLIFFWKYQMPVENGVISARSFFWLRFSRLYPLHLLTLVMVVMLQTIFHHSHGEDFMFSNRDFYHFTLNLFVASGWGLEAGPSFNAPIWSVSAEVMIYALFFLIVSRVHLRLVGLLSCIAVLSVVYKFTPLKSIALAGVYFFIGGLCPALSTWLSSLRFCTATLCLILVGVIGVTMKMAIKRGSVDGAASMLIALAVTLIAHQFDRIRPNQQVGKSARMLGNLTYASYLLHFPIQILFVITTDSLAMSREIYSSPIMLVSWITIVLLVSYLAFRFVELPLQRWLRNRHFPPVSG